MSVLWWSIGACVLLLAGDATALRVKRIIGGRYAEEPSRAQNEGGNELSTPPPIDAEEDSAVFVNHSTTSAVLNGIQNEDGSYSFLGIKYAEPPIKRLRFQRPKKLKLHGMVDATKYGPPCPQWQKKKLVGKEDCLYLNVFSPEVPTQGKSEKYPVIFWIHGGNFKTGSGAQYNPSRLVKKGIVVVTVNYRLGSLGFLSSGRKELPGNVGLFDLGAALDWTKKYIKHFGGDSKKITASGQGSGATAATYLGLNKHYKRHLRAIHAMSGTPVSPFTLDENEVKTAEEVAQLDGCNGQKDLAFVRCMEKLPLETVMKGDSGIQDKRKERFDFTKELSNLLTPGPATEGADDDRFIPNFLTQTPLEALKGGDAPDIPLLIGVSKDETGGGVKGNFLDTLKNLLTPSFLKGDIIKNCLNANTGLYENKAVSPSLSKLFNNGEYLNFFTSLVSSAISQIDQVIQHTSDAFFNLPAFMTSHFWSKKSNAYLYSFEHKGKSRAGQFLEGIPLVSSPAQAEEKSCGHGDDLIYLFDLQSLDGTPLDGTSDFTEADKKVREQYTSMVAEFARSGVPKTPEGGALEPFTKESGNYMVVDENPKKVKGFRKCTMALWTGDSNILSSAECGLGAASKLVTDTLGAAGTKLLESTTSAQKKIIGGLQTAGKKATDTLVSTATGAFGTLPVGGGANGSKNNAGGLGGIGGLGIGQSQSNKKQGQGGFGFGGIGK